MVDTRLAKSLRLGLGAFALVVFFETSAFATTQEPVGPSEFLFLVQMVVFDPGRANSGELMQRIGQPSVMGQLIAGILLGPSVFARSGPASSMRCSPPVANKRR